MVLGFCSLVSLIDEFDLLMRLIVNAEYLLIDQKRS
jgi:hypothetical protein